MGDNKIQKNLLSRYAKVLVWGLETARKSTNGQGYKPGDIVWLRFEREAIKLAEYVYQELISKGLHVTQQIVLTTSMEKTLYDLGSDEQLGFVSPWSETMYQHVNGLISLRAPSSLTHLKHIDSGKMVMVSKAFKHLHDIMDAREASGDFGWTLCMMPTNALAKQAKMTKAEYEQEIIKACYLHENNPVAKWQQIYEDSQTIKKWLNALKVNYFHIESANADLKVYLGRRRKWLGISGHNIPSFEIFVSPDCRKTEGVYFANMPSFRNGNYVRNVRLEFSQGSVVKATAEDGEEFLNAQLSTDEGSRRLGEFSLTDKRFSPITKFMANILFDENVGGENGNCHIAVGSSFAGTYNGNQMQLTPELKKALGFNDSAMHWDLINTESKIVTAHLKGGGQIVIYENGEFKY